MSEAGRNPFQIAESDGLAGSRAPHREQDPSAPVRERIDRMVGSAEVFLFIKGTAQQPMCGFSANTLAVMDALEVSYETFDVLSDEGVRSGAKEYSRWPTFPQVYVRGEFIGGNDIVTEMFHSGELVDILENGAS